MLFAGIAPPERVTSARVFFRSSLYSDFYYVEMEEEEGYYVAVLPQPSDQTPEVIYYVEALDDAFESRTSREYHVKIEGRCRRDPAAVAYLAGGTPAISVGSTAAGAAMIPPGFAATGIVGTLAAVGAAAATGGGIGAGAAVAVGAAAAGAAGVAVAATGGDPPASTTSVSVGVSTTMVATTTAPRTSSTTSVPPATTSSARSTTTVSGPPLDASCFTVEVLGPCRVRLDATCVALPVDSYEWRLDLDQQWERVRFRDAPAILEFTWSPASCGADAVLRFRLKVRRGEEESSFEKELLVPGDELKAPESTPLQVGFRSRLLLDSGSGPGRILVNGVLVGDVASGPPLELRARAKPGKNTLTAFLPRPEGVSGRWRFDFRGSQDLVPGSLRVRAGRVLAGSPDWLVLEPGERIELVFELRPAR